MFNCSLLGRSALMAARESQDRKSLLSLARKSARKLESERVDWVHPLAQTLRAGIAQAEGDSDTAARLLTDAADAFDRVPMDGYAAAARWRAASLLTSPPPMA